ncbi:hypothetical protein [Ideonella sp. YS5]|uniref:hypothetical protein n=1 Tax=Ideonella sp. YS5 TaxID=3453714 RepID=UPI003EEB62F0
MRIELLVPALVSALCLSGCGTKGVGETVAPLYSSCTHVTESLPTCTQINSQWVCPVSLSKNTVTNVPGVDPFELRAKGNASVVVVWRISGDAAARFHVDDGPTWINVSPADMAAITDAGPTSDSNGLGSASSSAEPYYRIRLATQPGTSSQNLKYSIKYHDGSGNAVVCDPYINNSGG